MNFDPFGADEVSRGSERGAYAALHAGMHGVAEWRGVQETALSNASTAALARVLAGHLDDPGARFALMQAVVRALAEEPVLSLGAIDHGEVVAELDRLWRGSITGDRFLGASLANVVYGTGNAVAAAGALASANALHKKTVLTAADIDVSVERVARIRGAAEFAHRSLMDLESAYKDGLQKTRAARDILFAVVEEARAESERACRAREAFVHQKFAAPPPPPAPAGSESESEPEPGDELPAKPKKKRPRVDRILITPATQALFMKVTPPDLSVLMHKKIKSVIVETDEIAAGLLLFCKYPPPGGRPPAGAITIGDERVVLAVAGPDPKGARFFVHSLAHVEPILRQHINRAGLKNWVFDVYAHYPAFKEFMERPGTAERVAAMMPKLGRCPPHKKPGS